jgi:hypothetical protein
MVLETLALAFTWRRHLRANPEAIRHMIRRGAFYMNQVFMITVYPVYYHVFRLVPASSMPRLVFLCLLPLLKIINRQLFYYSSRKTDGGEKFVPQVIVFSADVFGALFVAFCMQYKPSLVMAVAIAAAKVFTAAVSSWDLHAAGGKLAALEAQIRACQPPNLVLVAKASVLDEVAQIVVKHGTISFASLMTKCQRREELQRLRCAAINLQTARSSASHGCFARCADLVSRRWSTPRPRSLVTSK